MDIKATDLISVFERELGAISNNQLDEIGMVLQVADSVCTIYGLKNAVLGEVIEFEHGNKGSIFQLNEDTVSVFLFSNTPAVSELEVAKRTKKVFMIGVGDQLLGRVINAQGMPIDGLGDIAHHEWRATEAIIPGVIERSPINEPLQTGILTIDALVPIGKGQRELIIGNRGTGKSSIITDVVVNQKDKDVICVLVVIGARKSNLVRTIARLQETGALDYTVIVVAQAGEPVLNHYSAPYVGCTIAEYFRDQGKDVLIMYDDLSNHAIAFREMSLLLRRSPGREAYPGDVFYLHSRLLERAGKLLSGGSITALPLVQIQNDDITAYIPTNLISITDGQIFLDTKLFNQGIRPAVNTELSVSRVGGAAQTAAMRKMTKALKLELAQYHELLAFAQFDTELDEVSRRQINRGTLAVELLKQPNGIHYSLTDQALMLFLYKEGFLDSLAKEQVLPFAQGITSYCNAVYPLVYNELTIQQDFSHSLREQLLLIAQEFKKIFPQSLPS